jgi:transposase
VRPLPDEATRHLGRLVARRRQLLEMLVAERNRRHAAEPPCTGGSTPTSAGSEEALAEIERDLDRAVRESAVWRAKEELLRSVPGVGPVSARTLLGRAARARLAHPPPGRRPGRGGAVQPRQRHDARQAHGLGRPGGLRACLYMAAVAAARGSNPAIAGFYERLRLAGKPAKLALTACMRKLVVVLNAMLRTDTAWKQA